MTSVLQAGAVAAVVLGTGAATVNVMASDLPDLAVPNVPWAPGVELDGKTFDTVDVVAESGEVMHDMLHFANGRFQSAMCQEYCDFGWAEYRTWTEGGVMHFTATTDCPDAPHTVVWYGRVSGDDIEFEGTWTTRRWYWTRQLNVAGEGTVTAAKAEVPAG
ncbi:hypothetical protein [Aestuariicoccus sp. MJ-SS9]|uniref:hypothetical protein n=1 Tax=Aestuariicoccus sp. MJ-SS9 TaxID=3079855 RepID=UPI0029136E91|nr:hypothetical protein [Aestuariicoccus sp. MJ-SS9]MDU8913823.1 hypothetical protein [Aestuariicoccus sp. MJ-SS9]